MTHPAELSGLQAAHAHCHRNAGWCAALGEGDGEGPGGGSTYGGRARLAGTALRLDAPPHHPQRGAAEGPRRRGPWTTAAGRASSAGEVGSSL